MADATVRAIAATDVFRGRVSTIGVGDGTDLKWQVSGLNIEAVVTVSETVEELVAELEDGTEVISKLSRDVKVDFLFSELYDTDIDLINGATIDEINFATSTGGDNGTGRVFNLDNCDHLEAFMDNLGTHITASKAVAGDTLAYTITDNAA